MLVGSTLHEVVSEQLRLRPEGPAAAPIAQIQAEIERRVLKQMRESRNRDWERFKNPKRYAMLFEDYYGPGVDERGQDAALGTVRSAVNGLAASKYARRAFAVPKERIRIIDPTDFGEMKIRIDDVPVYASPDLVVEDDRGNLHVVDWKTGTPAKANVAQLAVYGLYVAEKLGAPLERITAHLVYLRTGDVHVYANLREGVAEARRRIATYTADVRSRLTDVENNVAADAALFPMTENRALCRRCNFQEICGRVAPKPEPPVEEADDL
jgi:CRISPR/Cas system-associated exonuclease Cas4 (RecB family)